MAKSKVFITGIAGFLGSHLADRMLELGHDVAGCDNMLGGYDDNVPEGAEFHRVDAQDFEGMKKAMRGSDVVYHCAAAPYEGLSVFSPKLVTEHTYLSTVATMSAAIVNNLKRIVFCSSMARYGHQGGEGGIFHEGMKPEPVDPYGLAKYASESFIEMMADTHGIEYVLAVPHNIFGPRQKYDDPFRNVISIMINRMLQGDQPIIYGDGEQRRSFTFVDNAINPLEKLGFQNDVVGEVFNIGPDEEFTTINELAETIAELIDFKLDPIYVDPRPREVKNAGCSANKARERLDYKTATGFREGVEQNIAWIKNRGVKPFKYHLPLEIVNDKTPVTWTKKLF
jgi:UDP-glucose 4-epimerase